MSFLLVAQRALTVPGWVKNALWRAAKATPSLDLPFADSKSLVDAITGRQLISYARAGSGTYTDSAGVLSTATTNLVLGSADFSATYTALGNVTVSSDATVAPDGSLTADSVAGTSSTLNLKNWYKNLATNSIGTYTASVYLKANTQSIVLIRINDNTGSNGARQLINLSTGALSGGVVTDGTATGASSTISNAGNGWYRCTITCTFNSAVTSLQGPAVFHDGYTTSTSTNNYFAWGAQLEQSSTVGEYIPTGSTINSAPRFDHNPLTGESLGLLVEEQRTNSIRNNTMVGAVAGTPGTLPTNWAYLATVTGITTEIVGTGVSSGINYIDIRLSGTAAAAGSVHLVFDANTAIAASTGQVWTASAYFAIVSGSFSNIASANLRCTERASGGTFVGTSESSIAGVTSNLSTNRVSATRTLGATAAFVQGAVFMSINSGAVIDITLRIGLPQLEQGATASSVIPNPSTTAAATRNADIAQITGTNFSSWYRQDEGTVYVDATLNGIASQNYFCAFPSGTVFDNSHLLYAISGATRGETFIATASQATITLGSATAGQRQGIAYSYRVNNFAGARNGTLGTPDTSGSLPTPDRLTIGMAFSSALQLNGTIKRLTFWPQALPGQLQAITQP